MSSFPNEASSLKAFSRLSEPEYQYVVRHTPHLTPRTAFITWVVLTLFVAFVIAVVIAAQVASNLPQ
jgi:hypothetical protein